MRLDYNSPEALAPVIEALVFASDEPLSAQELRSLILGEEQPKTSLEEEQPEAATSTEPSEAGSSTEDTNDVPPVLSDEPATETTEQGEISEIEATPVAPKKPRKRKQLIELTVIKMAVEQLNAHYLEQNSAFRIVEIAGGFQFATRPEFAEYVVRLFKEKSRRRLSGAALETLAIIAYKQPVSKLDVENIRGVNCDEVLKSLLEKNLITITGRAEAVGRPLLYGTTVDFLRHFGLPEIGDLPKPREIEELMKEESIRATTLDEAAIEYFTPGQEDVLTVDEILVSAHAGENVETKEDLDEDLEEATDDILEEEAEGDLEEGFDEKEIEDLELEESEIVESRNAESMVGIELDVEAMELNTAEATTPESETKHD